MEKDEEEKPLRNDQVICEEREVQVDLDQMIQGKDRDLLISHSNSDDNNQDKEVFVPNAHEGPKPKQTLVRNEEEEYQFKEE